MLPRRGLLRSLFAIAGNMLLPRSALPAASADGLSVKAFGAIGDGRSHPVSEWIPSRYPDFDALRTDYPDVRSLSDEIDFVAINKAVRIAGERGVAVRLPAGTYRAWVYIHTGNVTLIGAGSDVCRIRLPDNAIHTVVPEDRGRSITGTPCVIEAGVINDGNRAAPLRGLSLSGLTLDGNSTATRPPNSMREDIFGWGLAFTRFSEVRYRDIVAVNCHAGGIGTFIYSDHHDGEASIRRCGLAMSHPGFDVNSSHNGRWTVNVDACPYGVRLLDNCWECAVTATIRDAVLAGVVCDNQAVNESYRNAVTATVLGGCRNAGVQVGDGWSRSRFALTVTGVNGIGVNSRGKEDGRSRGEVGNTFVVTTRRCGQQGVRIGGFSGSWRIDSANDGALAAPGSVFAVDVQGSSNRLEARVSDDRARRLRGLILRPNAASNKIRFHSLSRLLEGYKDQGRGNSRLA